MSSNYQPSTCEVCGEVVKTRLTHTPLKVRNSRQSFNVASQILCQSAICKRIASKRDSLSPHLYRFRVEAHRKSLQARRERTTTEIRRIKLLKEKIEAQNKAAEILVKSQLPQLSVNPRLISIPTGRTKLVTLPSDRAEKYRERLSELITKASEYSNLEEILDDEENEVREKAIRVESMFEKDFNLKLISDQLCGMCKGGCCAAGSDHAYLSVSTVRRFMDDNPTLSPTQVLDAYMEELADETVEDSCINQTSRGCGLPRKMRSNTCNSYYCDPIQRFHEEVSDPESELTSDCDAIAVQRNYVHWDRECENACHNVTSVSVLQSDNITELDISTLE